MQYGSLVLNQFEKDIEFYQLFLLLINKSCPIKRVDVVWASDGPAVRVGLSQKTVCTEAALASRCADLIGAGDSEPHFCNLVNDYGRHQAESCAISDAAAEWRVRDTGKTSVYRCHAGLVDIAVPVVCDGLHLATLFAGQALTEPKSEQQFVRIRESLSRLAYPDLSKLRKAYWRVPQRPAVSHQQPQDRRRRRRPSGRPPRRRWTSAESVLRHLRVPVAADPVHDHAGTARAR